MKFQIVFEVNNSDEPNFGEAKGLRASLHEALCQGIHEGSEDAMGWLEDSVENVGSPVEVKES